MFAGCAALEIQNTSEAAIELEGYTSNQPDTAQYELPKDISLGSGERLHIYVGEQMYRDMLDCDGDGDDASLNLDGKSARLVGDYTGGTCGRRTRPTPGSTTRARRRWPCSV